MADALVVFPLLLLGTAVLAAGRTLLPRAVQAYWIQGLLLAAYLALAGLVSGQHALYGAALTFLAGKGIILPWLLLRFARRTSAQSPAEGSALGAAVAGVVGFTLGQFGLGELLRPIPGAAGLDPVLPFGLGAGLCLVVAALWVILAHRDTFKVTLGVCLLENGAHLLLAAFAWSIPELLSGGVILDVILAVWLLLYVGRRAEEATGVRSDAALDRLQG
jgi:hydrogenase-4 component E